MSSTNNDKQAGSDPRGSPGSVFLKTDVTWPSDQGGLGKKSQREYASVSSSVRSEALVFCIHGNKFGFAKCCDELEESVVAEPDFCDRTPLLTTPTIRRAYSSNDEYDRHCHEDRSNAIDKVARRKLIIASVLCIIFIVVEVVGGVMSNSLAIATDAAHLLSDFASFMISLFALWVASRPATRRMSFGFHRAEVIGATISVLLIWVITGVLVYMAVQRVISADHQVNSTVMLITSGIGIVVNVVMGCSLHQHGHTHGSEHHGHSHQNNLNVRAAFIHVLGDILQSVGVFIAALVIFWKPEWSIIDPICTFVFSLLVLATTLNIFKDTVHVLMEGIPENVNFNEVKQIFLNVRGIISVHSLRIWGLTTDKAALSVHLAIEPGVSAQLVLTEASQKIRALYNFYEMTMQVEDFHETMEDCKQCQNPV